MTLGAALIIAYNDPTQNAGEFLVTPGLFAIAWLAGFALRERSAQAASAEERALEAEREREENARRAVFDERVRIARELHDVVAHHVSMMGVQAGAARVVIDRDPAKAKEALAAIETSSRQAVAELHRLLGFLRQDGDEDDLAPQPGRRAARAARREHERRAAGRRRHASRARRAPLPQMVDVSAYRIVQEALTNTLKHARASHADVHLRYWPDELEVEVVDDGRGARNGAAPPGGRARADRHARARRAARRAAERGARAGRRVRRAGAAPDAGRARCEHRRPAGRRPGDGAGRAFA